MKPAPAFDRVVASSRDHFAHVVVTTGAGDPVGVLPITAGTVRGSARTADRWTGTLTVADPDRWSPTGPASPLAGFTGHRARVQAGATIDEEAVYVTVADLLIRRARITRAAGEFGLDVDLVGLAGYAAEPSPRSWAPVAGESCQTMMGRVLSAVRPPSWPAVTVVDSSTPVAVPTDYVATDRDAWTVVQELAGIANVTATVDAYSRLVIRPPLPATAGPPVRAFDVAVDVVDYTLAVGPDPSTFANRLELRCAPTASTGTTGDVVGVAQRLGPPFGVDVIGAHTQTVRHVTGTITQANADARAAALLAPWSAGWLTVVLSAAPDPRLEPDDDVTVTYPTGTVLAHRVTEVAHDLGTGAMNVAARTFTDTVPPAL